MEAQKVVLVAIIIVLFAALGLELRYIEETLTSAFVPLEKRCERTCSEKDQIPYVSENTCFCREPITFRRSFRCFWNATFEDDKMLSSKFNATAVRDIAVRSAVKYSMPNTPASKVFSIFSEVSGKIGYVSDPRQDEYVAGPLETWNSGGGDCDDFSVLLASMYESVGLDASMAEVYNATYGHVFVLVKIEQDMDSFLGVYKSILEKYTMHYSEKPFNFVVFAKSRSESRNASKSGYGLTIRAANGCAASTTTPSITLASAPSTATT